MRFEWDPTEDQANQQRHGLSFSAASELFASAADYLEIYDEQHSEDEDRCIAIGAIRAGVVVVVFTEPQVDLIRILSARGATDNEIRLLRQHVGGMHVI